MLIEFVIHSSLNINRIGGDPYDQFMSTSRIFALMIWITYSYELQKLQGKYVPVRFGIRQSSCTNGVFRVIGEVAMDAELKMSI